MPRRSSCGFREPARPYTPATLTCFAHAPSVGHGMRIRQAFAPDLLATLLVLIPALVPTVSLLAGPPLPILRDITREAGLNLVTICCPQ